MRAGMGSVHDRMDRVEKQTSFIADEVSAMGERILQGTAAQPQAERSTHDGSLYGAVMPVVSKTEERSDAIHHEFLSLHNPSDAAETEEPRIEENKSMLGDMFRDNGFQMSASEEVQEQDDETVDTGAGLGTLLSRYFQGENDKGVIYH